jgi:polyphosphate kinase 2 (PPK2 family)
LVLNISDFRFSPEHVLAKLPTHIDPLDESKKDYETQLADANQRLSALQEKLFASHRFAALVVLQGMDAAGKDSVIKYMVRGVHPAGVRVIAFKPPTEVERLHDFLWRTNCGLPQRGEFVFFHRSYYEEVLIVRVHPELLQAERIIEGDLDRLRIMLVALEALRLDFPKLDDKREAELAEIARILEKARPQKSKTA